MKSLMIHLGESEVQDFKVGDLVQACNVVVTYSTESEGNKWPYDLFINKGSLGIIIEVSKYWFVVQTSDGVFKCQNESHFRILSRNIN